MSDHSFDPATNTLTVIVPLRTRRRGERRQIVAPADADTDTDTGKWAPPSPLVDNTLVKALARAHRWKRLLENGTYATLQDLSDAEKINPSYVSRILRLTLLAPDLVEAILDGRQPPDLKLDDLLKPFPVEWETQRRGFAPCQSAEICQLC